MPEAATDLRTPAVELRDLAASSGGFEILTELNAAFPEGETSVVLGAAGSGKSTMLKAAAGILVPDHGAVLYHGKDIARFSRKEELDFRAKTGFVFQDAALWQNQNIMDNVAMPLKVHRPWMKGAEVSEAVRALLARLGYDEGLTMRPAELSAGEQKLVSIARAVIHEPDLVFMDDPTSNLDEDGTEHLFELIEGLRARGATVIVVTNNSDLAYRYADRLGVVKGGCVVVFGPYEEAIMGAESALSGSLARLKARGGRQRKPAEAQGADAGSEMSQRGDV